MLNVQRYLPEKRTFV